MSDDGQYITVTETFGCIEAGKVHYDTLLNEYDRVTANRDRARDALVGTSLRDSRRMLDAIAQNQRIADKCEKYMMMADVGGVVFGSNYEIQPPQAHVIHCTVCGEPIKDSEEAFRGVGRHPACVTFANESEAT